MSEDKKADVAANVIQGTTSGSFSTGQNVAVGMQPGQANPYPQYNQQQPMQYQQQQPLPYQQQPMQYGQQPMGYNPQMVYQQQQPLMGQQNMAIGDHLMVTKNNLNAQLECPKICDIVCTLCAGCSSGCSLIYAFMLMSYTITFQTNCDQYYNCTTETYSLKYIGYGTFFNFLNAAYCLFVFATGWGAYNLVRKMLITPNEQCADLANKALAKYTLQKKLSLVGIPLAFLFGFGFGLFFAKQFEYANQIALDECGNDPDCTCPYEQNGECSVSINKVEFGLIYGAYMCGVYSITYGISIAIHSSALTNLQNFLTQMGAAGQK